MNKIFDLDTKYLEMIKRVKKENNFKTDVQALRFIMDQYDEVIKEKDKNAKLVEILLDAFNEKYSPLFERLRWATRTAEKNSTILLDACNTILINNKINDCVPVEVVPSPVIETSGKIYKEKIDHFKQAKEDRKQRARIKG